MKQVTPAAETMANSPDKTQLDKFKEAAAKAEADPDEKAWEERLKKVARQKPADKPE